MKFDWKEFMPTEWHFFEHIPCFLNRGLLLRSIQSQNSYGKQRFGRHFSFPPISSWPGGLDQGTPLSPNQLEVRPSQSWWHGCWQEDGCPRRESRKPLQNMSRALSVDHEDGPCRVEAIVKLQPSCGRDLWGRDLIRCVFECLRFCSDLQRKLKISRFYETVLATKISGCVS